MKLTRLFLIVLSLGIVMIGISLIFNLYIQTFIFYNIILVLLAIIDYFITPINASFEVERISDRKLSLLEEEKIKLSIHNKSKYIADLEALQELPTSFKIEKEILRNIIPSYSSKEYVWNIKPCKRGAFIIEDYHIRRRGRLGLIKKEAVIKNKEEYKVYPSLKNLKKYHMMLRRDSFSNAGSHIIHKKDTGREFESLREYVRGDDIRKINWIKSGRENKLIVNQHEPENNKNIYILLDKGRTMSYRIDEYSKLDLAINACVFLSDVACYNKDQSGLLIFNTKVDSFIKPAKGDYHRNQILEALYHVEGTKSTSNYDEALFYISTHEKRRSLICIFTDIDTLQEVYYIEKSLEYVIKKHHVIMFLLSDEKLDKVISPKTQNKRDLFIKGTAYKMKAERKDVIKALNKKGVTCIQCDKEDIVYKAINEYMRAKNREII